tara:strand:- start:8 stop:487 length:480 start_codon:yes stop_codon:yes gene_type:complete
MNNVFSSKSFMARFSAPMSTGPAKATKEVIETFDKDGDGKPFEKEDFAKLRQEQPAKRTRAKKRLEKTKEKAQDAKDATRGKKSSESEEVKRQANKAKRLDKKVKRQEGRAERKKVRKNKDLSKEDKKKQISDSRKKQKGKDPVVEKKKPGTYSSGFGF